MKTICNAKRITSIKVAKKVLKQHNDLRPNNHLKMFNSVKWDKTNQRFIVERRSTNQTEAILALFVGMNGRQTILWSKILN
jgi:hypothetical protein